MNRPVNQSDIDTLAALANEIGMRELLFSLATIAANSLDKAVTVQEIEMYSSTWFGLRVIARKFPEPSTPEGQ